MHSSRRPVAIDLFAGAGGFSLGIEQAGFDVAVAVEYDPIHAGVHAFNFPQTKVLCADVAQLSGQDIQKAVGEWAAKNEKTSGRGSHRLSKVPIDLVFGGPPCQGFSTIGKRQIDDVRNTLVFEFCRLVKELQPRYFVMENVPGLRMAKYSHILERLMSEFKAAGYELTEPVQVLNAANFGVPQQRRRLFILGSQVGLNKLAYPEPELRSPSEYITVKDAIADLPNLDDFAELHKTDCIPLTPAQIDQMHEQATLYVQKLRNLTSDFTNFAYSRWWNSQLLTSSMQTQHTETSIERFKETPAGKLEPISRLRRLDWHKPCHTLRAGTGSDRGAYTSPRPIHPEYPRVISVREAARLHSFPDWFRFHITKWHGFRQVGNAVPPLLARALGDQILAALEVKPLVPQVSIELGNPQLIRCSQLQASKYWKTQIDIKSVSTDLNPD
ncbi:DNA cytosine methyltransferase [Allocoleopsis sp.]|uniref:DNA cytosine methyltransferase n=1 Tax=Allocoleopsis sp. TaxID=3088169 RepID=UPI002FD0E41F